MVHNINNVTPVNAFEASKQALYLSNFGLKKKHYKLFSKINLVKIVIGSNFNAESKESKATVQKTCVCPL